MLFIIKLYHALIKLVHRLHIPIAHDGSESLAKYIHSLSPSSEPKDRRMTLKPIKIIFLGLKKHPTSGRVFFSLERRQCVDIFLISPVAKSTTESKKRIGAYVESLEKYGNNVHWPIRDTDQVDLTGGFRICRDNFNAIMNSDEIHIWYDETSGGSKFDMGGVFMLVEMLGVRKKIVIPNAKEFVDCEEKSFFKVLLRLAERPY